MGISRSVGQLNAKIDRWSLNIEQIPRESVKAACEKLRSQIEDNFRDAMGGDLKLSGLSKSKKSQARALRRLAAGQPIRGEDISVRVRIDDRGNGFAEGTVRVRGPAQLVESDVARHFVFPDQARADGYRTKTRSFATGEVDSRGRQRRQRIDTRAAAAAFGINVNVGRARLKFGNTFLVRTEAESKGRRPFRRGVDQVLPEVPTVAADTLDRATGQVFG